MDTAFEKDKARLKEILDPITYAVTQENATEPAFTGKYNDTFDKGIYVDPVSKEPLFLSRDKFASGCGWPAFSRPIDNALVGVEDTSHGLHRVEVRSKVADSHLGHVFPDGPAALGGLRFCINSAALEFVPYEEMEERGYGKYMSLLD